MLVGYARTSTVEQLAGLEAQERDLTALGCERVFSERTSSMGDRPQLQEALRFVREGDTLVVTKVDRLARSTVGLWDIVQALEAKGVALRVLSLGGETVDTKSATGRLILTIFAGFAQFERETMKERQREGIAKAKAEKRYKGRKPTARVKADQVLALAAQGKSMNAIALEVGIGKGSVHRIIQASREASV
ncbi:recombinase family protein [Hansschlegelia beijingensis]